MGPAAAAQEAQAPTGPSYAPAFRIPVPAPILLKQSFSLCAAALPHRRFPFHSTLP